MGFRVMHLWCRDVARRLGRVVRRCGAPTAMAQPVWGGSQPERTRTVFPTISPSNFAVPQWNAGRTRW
jgi:hypothetical protein